ESRAKRAAHRARANLGRRGADRPCDGPAPSLRGALRPSAAKPDELSGEAMTDDPRIGEIKRFIRDIPDFPKPGILFKDITPLLGDGAAFRKTIDLLAERVCEQRPQALVGIESRGFLFGAALA